MSGKFDELSETYTVNIVRSSLFALISLTDKAGRTYSIDPRGKHNLYSELLAKIAAHLKISPSNIKGIENFSSVEPKIKRLHYQYRNCKGGKCKKRFLASLETAAVPVSVKLSSQCLANRVLNSELQSLRGTNNLLRQKLGRLTKTITNIEELKRDNDILKSRLGLRKNVMVLRKRCGWSYSSSQKYRHRELLKKHVQLAVSSLNLPNYSVSSIAVKDYRDRVSNLSLGDNMQRPTVSASSAEAPPDNALQQIVHAKDIGLIGNRAYHEISMICKALPRSYRLKQLTAEQNHSEKLKDLPDAFEGVQQKMTDTLSIRIRRLISSEIINPQPDVINTLKVKLSGDGTVMGKRIHAFNFGYSFAYGHATASEITLLCIGHLGESYSDLTEALKSLVSEIRNLREFVCDGKTYKLEYFLTGDMKFLNCVLGIDACNSTYACLWCKCPKNDRFDMNKRWSMLDQSAGARTIEEITSHSRLPKTRRHNCSHSPIFSFIPVHHVVPDMLHLFLRISDRLIGKLMLELRRLDNITNVESYQKDKHSHLRNFETTVQSLNIHFQVFVNSETKQLTFSNLPLAQRRQFMKAIDIATILPGYADSSKVQWLWTEFIALYDEAIVVSSPEEASLLQEKAKKWVDVYGSEVYMPRDVTPYMHVFAYHLSESITLHGCVAVFSQQRFEQTNHIVTKNFFSGSNQRRKQGLRQVMTRLNRISETKSNNLCRKIRQYACSICRNSGHKANSCPQLSL